jgi:hypothetical protein
MPFVIDIDPVAFALFGIPVRWYGLILVAAVAVAIWSPSARAGGAGSTRPRRRTPRYGLGSPPSSADACCTSSRTSWGRWPSTRPTS